MADIDAGKLNELIYSFIFRNEGAISIPKSVRSLAYTQAVDIIVESIDFSLYQSFKAVPPVQFYGYATLVFQNCLSLEVPIRFPRQRIYFATNDDALSQWQRLAEVLNFEKKWFSFLFSFFTEGSENPPPPPSIRPKEPIFIELPLREVYVKLQDNSQFIIEYSQWEPRTFTGDDGLSYTGISQMNDGEKDFGLPSLGIQPRQNPSNNPWKDNSPPSSSSDLGQFLNLKIPSLSNPDESSAVIDRPATSDDQGYYLEFVVDAIGNLNGDIFRLTERVPCLANSSLSVSVLSTFVLGFPCGSRTVQTYRIAVTLTSYSLDVNLIANSSVNGSVLYGLLPESESLLVPNGVCS